jgi:large subunit ribosomal protein L24
MQRVRQDDLVQITTGKDRGKQGRVLRVLTAKDKVIVEGHNMVTKHLRPQSSAANVEGGRIQLEAPVHVSNVLPVCPGCDEAVRVGFEFEEGGDRLSKTRVCKKCNTSF